MWKTAFSACNTTYFDETRAMRNVRDAKSTTIRTYEPLILMSASGVDGVCDEVVNIADADVDVGPDSVDEQTQDAPSWLSWIRDSFSFGKNNRRCSTQSTDVVEHQIQTVEPRLLLSAESIAASANSATADDVEAAVGDDNETLDLMLRDISIQQERFRADAKTYVRYLTVEDTYELPESNGDEPVYSDALIFTDVPDTTLLTRPTFHWHHSEDVKEYEIYVGRRGETEAVFRTRGFTENEFQLPDDIEPGDYTIWARVYHNNGSFSRWGKGHDITIGGRPLVTVEGNQVTWDAVPSADRYEIWADHIDEFGNHIAEKVISRTDVLETSFTVADDHAGQNLVWWVRAIDERDDGVDRSAWSRAAYVNEPEFLPSPGNPVITQQAPCLTTSPNTACPAIYYFPQIEWTPGVGAEEYEIVIREIGAGEPHFRQRGITGTENTFTLRNGVDLTTDEVWIRALGTGTAKSRWVKTTEFTYV